MEVQLIRQLLEQLLDYHYDFYLGKLRDWFANRMSKEQFDKEMSSILRGEVLQLHNQLLLSILVQSCGVNISALNSPNSSLNARSSQALFQLQHVQQQQEYREKLVGMGNRGLEQGNNLDSDSVATCLFQIKPVSIAPSGSRHSHYQPDSNTTIDTTRRFPEIFTQEFLTPGGQGYRHRHQYFDLNVRVSAVPPPEPILSMPSEANLYGRFLMDAWSKYRLENVQPSALNLAVTASIDHLKIIVTAIIKQRKAYRMRDGRYAHSIGCPYPNPYLLQGHHLFDDTYSSETAKLADVMQIPAFLPTREEKERLAALEVAASVPSKYPHLRTKASLIDFYDAMQNNRRLIPNRLHGAKLREIILQRSKGYGDAYKSYDDGNGSKDLVPKTVYPIISY